MAIAERLIWAVDILAVHPADRILEIGCGTGAAAALVCEQIDSGCLVAIDQSATAIRRAEQRNRHSVHTGKVQFLTTALSNAQLVDNCFDKVFAVNVNVFWQQPAAELLVVRRVLAAGGRLLLCFQPPTSAKTHDIANRVVERLEQHNFTVRGVVFRPMYSASAVCITAEPL